MEKNKHRKPNGKYCQICKSTPAYDHDDAVKGRFCTKHYVMMLVAAITAIIILAAIV